MVSMYKLEMSSCCRIAASGIQLFAAHRARVSAWSPGAFAAFPADLIPGYPPVLPSMPPSVSLDCGPQAPRRGSLWLTTISDQRCTCSAIPKKRRVLHHRGRTVNPGLERDTSTQSRSIDKMTQSG